ncbi:uncharacterized protein BKA55DRAFT_545348 [Fusarium redolens]|uniref:Uncharacterized protein n=1 Tax=Fusarium redolens TaxID=48865 RepID=A0A9P9G1A8_FUSRE|nr:uncharacterized protein BKA55DRAFT_545348 [Fusarium redolens]KAH7230661.1 hypothetical protein BKA55DRAFT_545348 [Fusarium redolens]
MVKEDALFSTSDSLIRDDMINGKFQGFLALSREYRLSLSEKMLMEEKRRLRETEKERWPQEEEKERRLQEEEKRKPAFLVETNGLRCKRCTATRNNSVAQSFAEVAYCGSCLVELVNLEMKCLPDSRQARL